MEDLSTITLALIALWPVPVDSGAGDFLRGVHQVFPALTYERIEFSANILLFVPLGVLLMLILRRRFLILPIAIVVTVGIESAQALLLDRRTPSTTDIIANVTGACVGMLIVAVVERVRSRSVGADTTLARPVETDAGPWADLGFVPPPRPPVPARPPAPTAAPPELTVRADVPPLPGWVPPMPPLPGERSPA